MKKPKITLRQRAIIAIFLTYFLLTTYFIYFNFVNQHRIVEEEALKDAAEAVRLVSFDIYGPTAIFIITIFGGVMLTYFMESKMRGSLKRLIENTESIAQGDLNCRVEINIGDEIEDLGNSFNRMAQALSNKGTELIQAKNVMDAIFNGIAGGIAYISQDHRIIHANPTYWDLHGNIADEDSDDTLKCLDLLWREKGGGADCPGKTAIETGQPASLEKEIETEDGKKSILWIHAFPVWDAMEMPGGFIEYVMDITQQRKLETDLKSYTERLEDIVRERTEELKIAQVQITHQEKIAALGQMAAGVAHEIGNPLSALSSLVQSIDIQTAGEEKYNLMREQIKRISNIVKEMTDFTRPPTKRIRLAHINQILQSALGISRYDPRLKQISISTMLDAEIPALRLNEDPLLQVFMNIILNAADAIGGKGNLTITSRLGKRSAEIRFEDTGPGIPEDLLDRIFEPFFTTKDPGCGTGLGLSVSYGIMQSMGGKIKASNRKEGGAVFTVTIPFPVKGEINYET
ncbi:MAG: ATP-binding protein [Desulfobacterales bacterium]|nr:ATP-binding protein [Desulfobacterales bacterium]